MSNRIQRWSATLIALTCLCCATGQARACTGIRLNAKDGSVVYARTMEFDLNLGSNAIVVPRGWAFSGTTASGKPGLVWQAKYGAVGLNGLGQMELVDGVNEKGLAGGIFYLPGYAQYQEVLPGDEPRTLAPWELMTWILTNFATVDEVRAALPNIKVGDVLLPGSKIAPLVHYVVHDASGNSMVIEYLNGKLQLDDDPIGVITNAPDFEWHIKNLSNYVNLSAVNATAVEQDGQKLAPFGQGSGLLGIPGDFTPPSRFVRAAVLCGTVLPAQNGEETVAQAFHILDSFDIPRGTVRGAKDDPSTYEYTQWTSASDTRNLCFYFHSHDNRRVRRIDLRKMDLDAKKIVSIPLHDAEDVEDLTTAQDAQ